MVSVDYIYDLKIYAYIYILLLKENLTWSKYYMKYVQKHKKAHLKICKPFLKHLSRITFLRGEHSCTIWVKNDLGNWVIGNTNSFGNVCIGRASYLASSEDYVLF